MPPWVAFAPRSTTLLKRRAIGAIPTCRPCRDLKYRVASPSYTPSYAPARSASTQVSPAAINYRPNVPPQNRELHGALEELGSVAGDFVNLSRLQLALRGLEARDAVTRVAVLSLNNQQNAQSLARLLLADPLGDAQAWETRLGSVDGEGKAVLLKYGDEADPQTPNPLFDELAIPSRVLRSHNLEVLVSTLNIDVASTPAPATLESPKDAILVPKLQADQASGVPAPFPVHKTVILGEGLDSAIAYGRFWSQNAGDLESMIKVAIDLPPPTNEARQDIQGEGMAVNLGLADEALASFRKSIENAMIFERGWYKSGLPGLSTWLVKDLETSSGEMKPAIRALIESVADDVEAKVTEEDVAQIQNLAAIITPQQISDSMLVHLESWSEKAHTELRDQLDDAFVARNWHKLSWWKLFWRVDDVTMILNEILERRWLVESEKNAVYLAGRMNQAGFPETLEHVPEIDRSNTVSPDTVEPETPSNALRQSEPTQTALSTDVQTPQPWSSRISTSRTILQQTTIPPLQALSQRLVLTTLSTTSLSSALSALLYMSVSTVSLFEAGGFAALGLVFSLRRMQKLWERAREGWKVEVREEGRKTLKGTEEGVRMIVGGGIVGKDEGREEKRQEVERRGRIRELVGWVREVLGRM